MKDKILGNNDYLVICDSSNNTPDMIERNELQVDLFYKPINSTIPSTEYVDVGFRMDMDDEHE